MYILEELIEVKLKEIYSDLQVDNFYASFKDNMDTYKEKNHDAMENLFSFIDFT